MYRILVKKKKLTEQLNTLTIATSNNSLFHSHAMHFKKILYGTIFSLQALITRQESWKKIGEKKPYYKSLFSEQNNRKSLQT
jgi:aminoglycoside N3'-acetyltransferase